MVKYENSKIYKIVCNNTGMIYVGATTKKLLSQRLTAHVADYRSFYVMIKRSIILLIRLLLVEIIIYAY